ncbi:hypothetical protein HPB49_021157 [Dermacentor silvarum]|uniref:Uncharacterized protein n=1 Tax=Dermacentor silvarum TaxID=543639 RepID=A0ACB8C5C9_DERSI|nr:hypothetical protein HPB49_021157 [Dermacentor silvarum]
MAMDFNDALDDIVLAEEKYRQMGFTRGFSLGEEVGWRDGYQLGLQRGAQIATELGFYQGFVHAWITVLEREEIAKQRKMVALKALLEMTKNFPQVNIADEDMFEKLHKIRAKFKQRKWVVAAPNLRLRWQQQHRHPQQSPHLLLPPSRHRLPMLKERRRFPSGLSAGDSRLRLRRVRHSSAPCWADDGYRVMLPANLTEVFDTASKDEAFDGFE